MVTHTKRQTDRKRSSICFSPPPSPPRPLGQILPTARTEADWKQEPGKQWNSVWLWCLDGRGVSTWVIICRVAAWALEGNRMTWRGQPRTRHSYRGCSIWCSIFVCFKIPNVYSGSIQISHTGAGAQVLESSLAVFPGSWIGRSWIESEAVGPVWWLNILIFLSVGLPYGPLF